MGLTSTTARVRGEISAAAASGSGTIPCPQPSGTARTPCMSSHILWLKYHGTGMMTSSPGPASVAMAAQKAWLQPWVMATLPASTRPP